MISSLRRHQSKQSNLADGKQGKFLDCSWHVVRVHCPSRSAWSMYVCKFRFRVKAAGDFIARRIFSIASWMQYPASEVGRVVHVTSYRHGSLLVFVTAAVFTTGQQKPRSDSLVYCGRAGSRSMRKSLCWAISMTGKIIGDRNCRSAGLL